MECVYEEGGDVMDYSNTAGFQKWGRTLRDGGGDKRQQVWIWILGRGNDWLMSGLAQEQCETIQPNFFMCI